MNRLSFSNRLMLLIVAGLISLGCERRFHPPYNEEWKNPFGQSMPIGRYQLRDELESKNSIVVTHNSALLPETRYLYVEHYSEGKTWEKYRVVGEAIETTEENDLEVIHPALGVAKGKQLKTTWQALRATIIGRRLIQRKTDYEIRQVDLPAQFDYVENFDGQLIFGDTDATFKRYRIFILRKGKIIDVKTVYREHGK